MELEVTYTMLDMLLNIAGAFLQGQGDDPNRQLQEQTDLQKEFAKKSVQWRVQDARKAGINPLAALGVTPYNYKPHFVGGPNKNQSMGLALSRMANAMETTADKRLKNARALVLEKQARGNPMPGQGVKTDNQGVVLPSGGKTNAYGLLGPHPNVVYDMPRINAQGARGIEYGLRPMKMAVVDEYGWVRFVLAQQVSESLESDWSAQLRNMMLEIGRSFNAFRAYQYPNSDYAHKFMKLVRKIRNTMIANGMLDDPGKGAEWAYDPWVNGLKKRVKSRPGGHFWYKRRSGFIKRNAPN